MTVGQSRSGRALDSRSQARHASACASSRTCSRSSSTTATCTASLRRHLDDGGEGADAVQVDSAVARWEVLVEQGGPTHLLQARPSAETCTGCAPRPGTSARPARRPGPRPGWGWTPRRPASRSGRGRAASYASAAPGTRHVHQPAGQVGLGEPGRGGRCRPRLRRCRAGDGEDEQAGVAQVRSLVGVVGEPVAGGGGVVGLPVGEDRDGGYVRVVGLQQEVGPGVLDVDLRVSVHWR